MEKQDPVIQMEKKGPIHSSGGKKKIGINLTI